MTDHQHSKIDTPTIPALENNIYQSPFPLLRALYVRFETQQEVLGRLMAIETKLKKVSPFVQSAVAEILEKLSLPDSMANTRLMTVAIMAINPINLVSTLAANDKSIKEERNLAA